MPVDFGYGNGYDEVSDGKRYLQMLADPIESVQSPTLHTDLGIDRNELIRRLKQNIQSGQDGYPFVSPHCQQANDSRHHDPLHDQTHKMESRKRHLALLLHLNPRTVPYNLESFPTQSRSKIIIDQVHLIRSLAHPLQVPFFP
jgi:hypothetical protein